MSPRCNRFVSWIFFWILNKCMIGWLQGQSTATHCHTLQNVATHCNTQHHTATNCNTLQHTANDSKYCNMLQHTATYYNALQHTAAFNSFVHSTSTTPYLLYVSRYISAQPCTHAHTRTYARTHTHTCTHTHTHAQLSSCSTSLTAYENSPVYTSLSHTNAHTHTHTYAQMHTHTHTHTCAHAHEHIQLPPFSTSCTHKHAHGQTPIHAHNLHLALDLCPYIQNDLLTYEDSPTHARSCPCMQVFLQCVAVCIVTCIAVRVVVCIAVWHVPLSAGLFWVNARCFSNTVLQHVAACCSGLQRIAARCYVCTHMQRRHMHASAHTYSHVSIHLCRGSSFDPWINTSYMKRWV